MLLPHRREADPGLGPIPFPLDLEDHALAPLGVDDGLPDPQPERLGARAVDRTDLPPAHGRFHDGVAAAPSRTGRGAGRRPPAAARTRAVGDLLEEPAGRVVLGLPPQVPAPGVRQVEPFPGPGDPDVGQPPLLLHLGGLPERAQVGEDPVLHPDDEHHRVLETLGGVQGHQRHPGGVAVDLVGVGDQADLLEEGVEVVGLAGRPDQLLDVLDAAGRLDGVLGEQLLQVAGPLQDGFQQPGRADAVVAVGAQLGQQVVQVGQPGHGLAGDAGRLGVGHDVGEGDAVLAGVAVHPGHAGVADTAFGDVDDALERHLVRRVGDGPQIGEQVLDLGPVVEPGAAHHLVGDVPPDQLLLDGPALGVGAVEDGDVAPAEARRRRPPPAVQAEHLVGQPAPLVVLVLGVVATPPIRPDPARSTGPWAGGWRCWR